jgi:hypothetical protein
LQGFTEGSVIFAGANSLTENNAAFYWSAVDKYLQLTTDAGKQIRLAYDGGNFADFTVNNVGALAVAPTGQAVEFVSSFVTVGKAIILTPYVEASPTDGELWYDDSDNALWFYHGTTQTDLLGDWWGGVTTISGATYIIVPNDGNRLLTFSDNCVASLPSASDVGPLFKVWIESRGELVTLEPDGAETIDGEDLLVIPKDQGVFLCSDGSNWYTERGLLPKTTTVDIPFSGNLNPLDPAGGNILRMIPSGPGFSIQGILPMGSQAPLQLFNQGTDSFEIEHDSGGSGQGIKTVTEATLTIKPNQVVEAVYDEDGGYWYVSTLPDAANLQIDVSVISDTPAAAYGVLLYDDADKLQAAEVSSTSGVPLVSKGAGAVPAFDTAVVAGGGTGLTSYTLGDIIYCSATNVLSKLAGNTTTTRQKLTQTGTGSVSAAPVWVDDTVGPAPPNAPTSLAGTAGNTQITWNWTAPTGTPAATSYLLQVTTDSTFATGITNYYPTSTSQVVTGLTNYTRYYARVYGANNNAYGPVSGTAYMEPVPSASQYTVSSATCNRTTYAGNDASKAHDGNTGTYAQTNVASTFPVIWTFDLGSNKTAIYYRQWPPAGGGSNDPGTWTIDGSTDNVNWTQLDSRSGFTTTYWGGNGWRPLALTTTGSYRYYRISVTANDSGTNNALGEFQLWG